MLIGGILILLCWQPVIQAQSAVVDAFNQFARTNNIVVNQEYQKLWQQGSDCFAQGQYPQAAQYLGQAALASPDHPLPQLYFALALFGCEQYALAGQVMRRTLNLYHDWKNLPLNFPKQFPAGDDFLKRLTAFESWLFQEPRATDAYLLFGVLSQFSGELRKAELAYRLLLQKEPLCREALPFLEMIIGKEIDTAIPPFAQLKGDGEKTIEEKQYAKAINIWLVACAEYPEEPESLYALTYSLAAVGYFEQAAVLLQTAITSRPDILVAQVHQQAKWLQKESAWLTTLEEYFQVNPKRAELLFLLSYGYVVLGETRKARLAWKLLLQNDPGNIAVQSLARSFESPASENPDTKENSGSDKKKATESPKDKTEKKP